MPFEPHPVELKIPTWAIVFLAICEKEESLIAGALPISEDKQETLNHLREAKRAIMKILNKRGSPIYR